MKIVNKESYKELVIGNSRDVERCGNLYCLLDEIILQGETFIITDSRSKKLDYYYNELVQKGYTVYNININDYKNSDCWNPLDMPYQMFKSGETDKAKDYLVSIAEEIFLMDGQQRNEEFWGASSANLFVGLAYALFNIVNDSSMINFSSIYQMAEDGINALSPQTNVLKYFFDEIYDKEDYARANVNLVINAPKDTRGGILATFFQKIRALVMSDNVANIINYNGIDFNILSNEKIAIFLNYNPEQFTDQIRLINLFIRQSYLYACNADMPIHFILNDFLKLKYMPYIENMFLSQCRPNIYVFLDSISLFDKIYPHFSSDFLLTQSDQVLYLNIREFFVYSPDYLKEQMSDVNWDVDEEENLVILCRNDKRLMLIHMEEYEKNSEISYREHKFAQKAMLNKYDIKTQVMEHQRQKLLLGQGLNSYTNEQVAKKSNDNRGMLPSFANLSNEDIDRMIQDIDNKLKELDEEERQQIEEKKKQEEFQKVKKYEEIIHWQKKYFWRVLIIMSIINIIFVLMNRFI